MFLDMPHAMHKQQQHSARGARSFAKPYHTALVVPMSLQPVTLENLTQAARRTNEIPPRVSIYDVIAAAKGCDGNEAGRTFRRMLQAGAVPECEEVSQNLLQGNILDQMAHGGERKPVLVATAAEIVQIIWELPGKSEFRKNSADVVVRYLGGDPSLVEEVLRNRNAQEHLAATVPEHPARCFGEAVEAIAPVGNCGEATHKRLLDDVRDVVCEEMRRMHVWSFSKRSRHHQELERVGVKIQGEELLELD